MCDESDSEDQRGALYTRQVRALEELSRLVRPVTGLASLFRWIAIAAVVGLVIATLGDVVMIVFAAVLIAVLLRGLAQRLGQALHIGAGWGLAVVILGLIALLGALGWWRGQDLAEQLARLQETLAQQFTNLRGHLQETD